MTTQADKILSVLKMIFDTDEEDIGCGECDSLVGHYVDLIQDGQDPAVVLPKVKHHLEKCGNCQEELSALITVLNNQEEV